MAPAHLSAPAVLAGIPQDRQHVDRAQNPSAALADLSVEEIASHMLQCFLGDESGGKAIPNEVIDCLKVLMLL